MAQHRRGNREHKKPKQTKSKVDISSSPAAIGNANPVKLAVTGKRK